VPDVITSTSCDDFLKQLQLKYESNANLKEYWYSESLALREIIPQIIDKISFNYELQSPLGVGGSGIVAVVEDKNLRVLLGTAKNEAIFGGLRWSRGSQGVGVRIRTGAPPQRGGLDSSMGGDAVKTL
jgi:hypothetical protein